MALTRLDNLYSSKTGKYLYVSPDDFNATDELDNRGNSPLRPFKTIQRAFIEVARYSYLPGKNNDRFDQFSVMLMPGNHYIDNRPGLVDAANAEQRYLDAANLIELNKQEIIDRSAAEIAVQHPDFYFPGDPATTAVSRFKDAYRLIQQNRDEILDKALAQVAIDHEDFNFPGDPTATPSPQLARYDAYRLIQKNRQIIIDRAWDTMLLSYPGAAPTEAKCKRDLGIFVDAISLDLFLGAVKYSRKFVLQYFTGPTTPLTNGLLGEEAQSIEAFEQARNFMKQAITNTLVGAAYQDLTLAQPPALYAALESTIQTLTANVTSVINAGNTTGLVSEVAPTFLTGQDKCRRDIGILVDSVSLDVSLGGGNKYTRKFLKNYFTPDGSTWITAGLQGEEAQSNTAFNKAKNVMIEAITNKLYVKDLTITADPTPGSGSASNTNSTSCANVQTQITNLISLITTTITAGNITGSHFVAETLGTVPAGETKCKRDIGFIIDAVCADLRTGGNYNIVSATKTYFDRQGNPILNGLVNEEAQSITAFNMSRDMMKKAIVNELLSKDFTIQLGPAFAGAITPIIPHLASGNPAQCVDVQNTITTLVSVLTTTIQAGNLNNLASVVITGTQPVFNYNRALQEWQDESILDLSNPNNVLYKFNASTGGCIVPRGCSLIGYDLRRTIIRPLYVPDPADGSQVRTSLFNLTGGCYIWQFTIKDGDLSSNSPLYDNIAGVGKVYSQKGNVSQLSIPEFSHHKICIMEYADTEELDRYYEKVGRAFVQFQPDIDDGEFEALVQENRIVGPLSDTRRIESIQLFDSVPSGTIRAKVTTKIDHGYFVDQYVAILNSGLDEQVNGTFKVTALDTTNPKVFEYQISGTAAGLGLVSGQIYNASNSLSTNAVAQAEIDSVESASPYVFNCSIRSTWGMNGMWADGSKATGFKSMVVAQYTGVSLQKDDRAFIRYDKFTNTWNQASLVDAFATVPYHTKGDAYWKDDWRNFHIRASDDSFIQCVSVFAVGFHDHFLMESGGDMSITNSNSNFGNTSLHAKGFKGFSFNQDKGGYITDIIPPKIINTSSSNEKKIQYYTLDIQASNSATNHTKLYLGTDGASDPAVRPAASVDGFRIGSKTNEKLYVKLDNGTYYSCLEPTGFTRYTTSLDTLNPAGIVIDNKAQDAANQIEDNKAFIQEEAYQYIITKYPALLTNTSINILKCKRDIGYLVDAIVQDLRLGGNINSIQAAESYFVGTNLSYISGELTESIEAYDYVKNICIAAMRNFDYLRKNCETSAGSAIVDVGSTSGIIIGMRVRSYNPSSFLNGKLITTPAQTPVTSNIPANTYVKRIVSASKIELGVLGSKLTTGAVVNALQTSSTTNLYFDLPAGAWSTITPVTDPTITQDTAYPECATVASTITGYFNDFTSILNQGLTPVDNKSADASDLIIDNKQLIAQVAVDRMLTNFPGFSIPGGNQECIDDVLKVIDALAFNVKFGSNNKIYEAGLFYVNEPALLAGEREQSRYVYEQVRNMAIQAMRNETITITGSTLTQVKDLTITVDTSTPACANVATAITNLIDILLQAVGTATAPGNLTGVVKTTPTYASVTRVEPVIDYAGLSKRATIFTVNTGSGTTNPHKFETGTPVKLVPIAKAGTTPDKRVIRLPIGFETNRTYYVIAPGRETQPEKYNSTSTFDGSDQTKLMLAATKENAAAGIYIYSPETDAVDPNVQIEIQQYVLDETYDLHKYKCNIAGATELETDVSHIFDLPNNNVTPQKVFFRLATDIIGSDLPELAGGATINTKTYFFVRYITSKKFSIHLTHADAIAGTNAVSFVSGSGKNFYVYADKRISPLRFDPLYTAPGNTSGLWYLQVKDESSGTSPRTDSILDRFHNVAAYGAGSGKIRTLDTWFTRVQDNRSKQDRIYRLKYVIPYYLTTVRDPLNGFIIKARTDDKRRLVPQRIRLEPIGGAPAIPRFSNPTGAQERIGFNQTQLSADPINPVDAGIFNLSPEKRTSLYDPYNNPKIIDSDKTSSKIAFTIQSANQVTVGTNTFLELVAFDHTITNTALKNEIFTVVEINAPQGGSFVINNSTSVAANAVTWSGNSQGSAYIQGYFSAAGKHYLVLKNVSDPIVYNNLIDTRFTQGVVFADLRAKPNSIGDSQGRDKSNRKDYLYRVEGANVYTLVPGDIITDDASNNYRIVSVTDIGDFEDTFYIFDIDTIQERIPGQQDGVYYLTCLRGNISPFPTGAGVGDNFKNYKFSQPISQLYPLNYKNDPVWFKQLKASNNDVPASVAAADNYVHGLVTINDSKNSQTKELVLDLVLQPALNSYTFVNSETLTTPTLNPAGGSNIIEAQEGNATSGSEDRYIPISGNSTFPTQRKIYVELRRPSIARSGNHTFEYLGFGPGNYSTGFPLRQEVVLSTSQDQYAQSKREDGGIVFYTGLNSNGDLYIGNRKINAITGEETYLERAELVESDDDSTDNLGGLVTTFDVPVTFNNRITVEGNANFNNPVEIAVDASESTALRIYSVVDGTLGDDVSLSRSVQRNNNDGDITLTKNQIRSAIYTVTPRQSLGVDGQPYSFRTHFTTTLGPTNTTPDQTKLFSNTQEVSYSASLRAQSGDILLKGSEVGLSGSLGWIYANYYTQIADTSIQSISSDGTDLTITWTGAVKNSDVNVSAGSQIRISNFSSNTNLNGIWTVLSSGFAPTANSCKIRIVVPPASGTIYTWSTLPTTPKMEVARANWKEVGVIGAETLRTNTETFGDYKLGINTVSRATNDAYKNGFVETETNPVSNLDVAGTVFISGKKTNITVAGGVQTKASVARDDAFIVGGNHTALNDRASFRVSTIGPSGGKVGINASVAEITAAGADFLVQGSTDILGSLKIAGTVTLSTGNLDSPNPTFNLATLPTTVSFANSATLLNISNSTLATGTQALNIGNYFTNQTVKIGDAATTSILDIHKNSRNSTINIGTVDNANASYISNITIGGAFANSSSSFTVKNKNINLDGDVQIGSGLPVGSGTTNLYTFAQNLNLFSASGGPNTINFARTASILNVGADAGTTTINNSVLIRASETVNGDITLSGGLNAGGVEVVRGVFGTTPVSHLAGSLLNLNIDLYHPITIGKTLDTQGAATWLATNYTLFLNEPSSTTDINVGDFLLIDRSVTFPGQPAGYIPNQAASEIVRVDKLTNLNNSADPAGFRVEVFRGQEGTTAGAHPDNVPIVKLVKSNDVSFLTEAVGLNTAGANTVIKTAEFGGALVANDFLRLSNTELVKIQSLVSALTSIQSLRITDGGSPAVTNFLVESTTGNTTIKGRTDIYNSINLYGSDAANTKLFAINNGATTTTPSSTTAVTGSTFTVTPSGTPTPPPLVPSGTVLPVATDSMIGTWTGGGAVYAAAENKNPALSWSFGSLPTGITISSYTIYLEDLTATNPSTGRRIVHWHLTGIPSTTTTLPANATTLPVGTVIQPNYITTAPGTDGVSAVGYSGPQSVSSEIHIYRLTVTAVLSGNTTSVLTQAVEFTYGNINVLTAASPTFATNSNVIIDAVTVSSAVTSFKVDSANGNTSILGNLNVGAGFNKLTVTGSNGNTTINGGDFRIYDSAGTGNRLFLQNGTGNLTISGLYTSDATSGTNIFNSDLRLNGGDLQINRGSQWVATTAVAVNTFVYNNGITYRVTQAGTTGPGAPTHTTGFAVNGTARLEVYNHFRVNNNGTIDLGGLDYFYGPTGARRWELLGAPSGDAGTVTSNVNYFVNATGTIYVRLPLSPSMGDMIRFIDVGGNLKYDTKLVVRAATGVPIQGDATNIAATVTGITLTGYDGGELVVTTPNAAFGLVYAGPFLSNGAASGVPSDRQGWWLMEI